MESRQLKPYVIVIALMVLTSLALAYTVDVNLTNEAGIRVELPDRIGDWEGAELRYCQNPNHQREYLTSDLENPDVCPDCGHELYGMSLDERRILPADTIILKKRFRHPSGQMVLASIVLSGADRSSIHRPQLCLTGQGQTITKSETITVPIAGRDELGVMVLDLHRNIRAPDGTAHEFTSYYAYWFVGKGRETPSHLQRMYWMATDRIFFNRAHRWAYISVSGYRPPDSKSHHDQVSSFVSEFYPHMALN